MPNRLAGETSPYLLQHAYNPVDWQPWGEAALAEAKERDEPLLLSIGYAACHWCHVMERESFEDPEIGDLMNEWFVPVKVDREERPDVDAIYMAATQALTGSGGWPMTVFCMPDGTPFLAGTYFPPEERHGMPSFRRVLEQVHELWTTRRDELLSQGQRLLEAIERGTPRPSNEPLQSSLLAEATSQMLGNIDRTNGGFGGAPKFPQAPALEFLMRRPSTGEGLELTLQKMARGGIYDQLGGGFARYAVDATWTVPHFEKMLYDNAQLARLYTHAWQAFKDPLYKRIAISTLEYLLRDMRDARGGFHSSEDADSEGEEGKFYVFDYDDIAPHFGATPGGNFEGKNIPIADDDAPQEIRDKLLALRNTRIRPGKDDKVLASWNGLAIGAFAEAGAAFERADFVEAAREAARFVRDEMRDLHTYRNGKAHIPALLEDYAFMADGALALWDATFEREWLDHANELATRAIELFEDGKYGAFFTTRADADVIVRQIEIVESATPAPGGVLALVLQRLAILLGDESLKASAVKALRVAHVYMQRAPLAVPSWLSALDFYLSTPKEIAFTGPLDRALTGVVYERFVPNRVMAHGEPDGIELLKDKPSTDQPRAFVCEHFTCKAPTSDPEVLAQQLA